MPSYLNCCGQHIPARDAIIEFIFDYPYRSFADFASATPEKEALAWLSAALADWKEEMELAAGMQDCSFR